MNVIYEGEEKVFPVVIELTLEEAHTLLRVMEGLLKPGSPGGGRDPGGFLSALVANLRELEAIAKGNPSERR